MATVAGLGVVLGFRRWYSRQLAADIHGDLPVVAADDGVLLHVESDGKASSDAPVVVLVHGFCSSLREFDAQRETLRHHVRLVLYDQRGHGHSGWRGHRHATLDRLGRDLGTVLDRATDGSSVLLVGHSLGGMAVMALAERRPDLFDGRIVGVALLSTSSGRLASALIPRLHGLAARWTALARPVLWLTWVSAPLLDLLHPLRTSFGRRWLVRRLFGPAPTPSWAVARMEELWRDTSPTIATTFFSTMLHHERAEALSGLSHVPTLVLAGTEDATIPAEHSRRIAARLGRRAELVLVRGAGHMVNMSHPEQVNGELLRLLRRVRTVSPGDAGDQPPAGA